MRRLGTGLGAVALLGVALSAALADDVVSDGRNGAPARFAPDRPGNNTWDSTFGAANKGHDGAATGQPVTAPGGPPVAERAARIQQREKNAYMRRMQVCLRLQQIAAESNDADLGRQAEALLDQAWLIYQRRTASLHLSGPDEAVLDQHLGTDTAMPQPRAGAPAGDGRAQLLGEGRR